MEERPHLSRNLQSQPSNLLFNLTSSTKSTKAFSNFLQSPTENKVCLPDHFGSLSTSIELPFKTYKCRTITDSFSMRFQLLSTTAAVLLFGFASAQCDCRHNGDAGRWRDALSPADRVRDICTRDNLGCHDAERGRMCVTSPNRNQCSCAIEAANSWQSWNSDWWLWSSITCGDLSVTIT